MAPKLSTRISIAWPPSPPSEPTDTLVLGVGGYYMDLRVLKSSGGIDWALAGERIIVSEEPLRIQFLHTIDSRGLTAPDEGLFTLLPNGDDLETGSMPSPEHDGAIMPYEEIWRDLPFLHGPAHEKNNAWILESIFVEGGEVEKGRRKRKSFIGRIAGTYMALTSLSPSPQKPYRTFSARLETWSPEHSKWVIKYNITEPLKPNTDASKKKDEETGREEMGRGEVDSGENAITDGDKKPRLGTAVLPSLSGLGIKRFEGEESWKEGQKVNILGGEWLVRACEAVE